MSPVTHFLTGWVFANSASLSRRERALVTLACVVPDVDGLGIVAEYLTRHSQHPLEWFSTYHHSLHSLPFAVGRGRRVIRVGDSAMEDCRAGLFELPHSSVRRLAGKPRPGRLPMANSLSHAILTSLPADLARTMDAERLAQLCHHDWAVAGDVLSGVVAGILSVGDGLA